MQRTDARYKTPFCAVVGPMSPTVINPTILIIGGTGVFGRRLLTHLARFENIAVVFSSRSLKKAEDLATRLSERHPGRQIRGIALDHRQNLAEILVDLNPFAVIDCTGPFQSADYNTAETVLKSGAHLIDLADAREYLATYHTHLDDTARKHKVVGLSGASSTPALSTCVVRDLTRNWQRIDTIDICITPGGKSEVGASVIAAIMSYAGADIPTWRNGQLETVSGWGQSKKARITGLGERRVAPVETFDAESHGPLFNVHARVSFSAGLESQLEQWGMELIARLRRQRLVPHPRHLIPLLLQLRKITRLFTSDQGAMQVDVSGIDASGHHAHAKWSLLAKQDHGPFIPVLPAAAALRRLLENSIPVGARTADQALRLEDIQNEWLPYDITASTQNATTQISIFENVLKSPSFEQLPASLQKFHSATGHPVWKGKAGIENGKSMLARLILRFMKLPHAGTDVPVTVAIERCIGPDGERSENWTRSFDHQTFSSIMKHNKNGDFTESFGLLSFSINLHADRKSIKLPIVRWHIGRLPLPLKMAPQLEAMEFEDTHGRFNFDVKIRLPLVGMLVHYKGWLKPNDRA